MKALLDLVRRHQAGTAVGLTSVCSAHPLVIEATLRAAAQSGGIALIEATSNQVNQDGGYTGMRPAAFRDAVRATAAGVGLPPEQLALGGDHLGPNAWQHMDAAAALAKAAVLVREYVTAGFRKIHLDCSMACGGDPERLGDELIAERTASLCADTESAWADSGGEAPVYIIGSEVPVAGGAHETLTELAVTTHGNA
jgi:D-tagatose-1,6-bisphosphate aldolase subunit GatZ/KbaZ